MDSGPQEERTTAWLLKQTLITTNYLKITFLAILFAEAF